MSEAISEDSILDLLKDDSKFSAKIAELTRAKANLDTIRKDANAALAALAKEKTDTLNYVNGKKAELSAKQLEHDKAATEAATRIQLGRDQMAEVLRIREENAERDRALSAKESDLKAREKALADEKATIGAKQGELNRALDLVRRQQQHIAAMPKV